MDAQAYVAKRSNAPMTHREWSRIVGQRIAARSRVGKIRRGVLTLKVASSAWCNELSMLRSDLLEKLHRSGYDVRDIRLQVDASHMTEAGVAPRRGGRRPPVHQQPEVRELSPELRRKLAEVEDPNLRAAIAEAARWALRRPAR